MLIKPKKPTSTGETNITINSTGNAQPEHVLYPYTFSNADGVDKAGACRFDVNSSDATADKYNILQGTHAYGKGAKIPGVLCNDFVALDEGNNVSIPAAIRETSDESYFYITGDLGTATAADVARGKTFTTNAGTCMVGEALPAIDTSDADATAREICMDKYAYVNEAKVKGTGLIYKLVTSASSNKITLLDIPKSKSFAILTGWATIETSETTGVCRFACTLKPDGTIAGSVNSTNYVLESAAFGDGYRLYLNFSRLMSAYRPPSGGHSIESITCDTYYRIFKRK